MFSKRKNDCMKNKARFERREKYCVKHLFTFILFIIITPMVTFCQEKGLITFGKVSPADFNLPPSKVIDSNTDAVIIADVGNTDFIGNKNGWVSYIFKRKKRIKIINKQAFNLATIKLMLYKDENVEEVLSNVQASSYNLLNGEVVESKLEKKDIFEDRYDKKRMQKKFTLPAVKEGTIIEYSYTITSDYVLVIPQWQFQDFHHPCLWSQYEITVPESFSLCIIETRPSSFFY